MEEQPFGRYQLLHRISAGTTADVFLARDLTGAESNRLWVIKRIRRELCDNRDFVVMLLDEERMISRLAHPSVVKAREFGRVDGQYFLALEHVWGENLATVRQLCAQHKLAFALPAALYVGTRIGDALHYAHTLRDSRGQPSPVVHRDVTLSNVIAGFDGEVKILDFGIAKAKDSLAQTRVGYIKGTLPYLAPEQLLGTAPGPASDVYQLGVCLYQLLVGRTPVQGATEGALMEAIVDGRVTRPSDLLPAFPRVVEHVLLKALARDPQARQSSAGELAQDLLKLLGGSTHEGRSQLVQLLGQVAGERKRRQGEFLRTLLAGKSYDAPVDGLFGNISDEPQTIPDHALPAPNTAEIEALESVETGRIAIPSRPAEMPPAAPTFMPGQTIDRVFTTLRGPDPPVERTATAVSPVAGDPSAVFTRPAIDLDTALLRSSAPPPTVEPVPAAVPPPVAAPVAAPASSTPVARPRRVGPFRWPVVLASVAAGIGAGLVLLLLIFPRLSDGLANQQLVDAGEELAAADSQVSSAPASIAVAASAPSSRPQATAASRPAAAASRPAMAASAPQSNPAPVARGRLRIDSDTAVVLIYDRRQRELDEPFALVADRGRVIVKEVAPGVTLWLDFAVNAGRVTVTVDAQPPGTVGFNGAAMVAVPQRTAREVRHQIAFSVPALSEPLQLTVEYLPAAGPF